MYVKLSKYLVTAVPMLPIDVLGSVVNPEKDPAKPSIFLDISSSVKGRITVIGSTTAYHQKPKNYMYLNL